jgi:glutathione S-transferase
MTNSGTLVHYHAPNTRSSAIRWLFEELGVPHELKVFNTKKGEHKSPEYLAINPMGKVPAISHNGQVVTETGAICIYLADLFPEAGLAPKIGEADRAPYLRWIVFYHSAVEPAIVDHSLKREAGPSSMLPYGSYDETINALASALAKGPYLLGERFSAADVLIGSSVRWMLLFKMLPERPEFTRYAAQLSERPALKRALEKDAALAAQMTA